MKLLKKAAQMFGLSPKDERPNPDIITADLTRALQANERAGTNAQRALEELLSDKGHMAETFKGIVGKM